MTAAAKRLEVVRPQKPGFVALCTVALRDSLDLIFRVLRAICPIVNVGPLVIVSRNDDVREVLADHTHFHVEQVDRLKVIMDDAPFMLGLDTRAAFDRSVAPMHAVVTPADIPDLALKCSARASQLIASSGGRLEVVDFVRQITLDVLCEDFGVPQPQNGDDLRIMAMRLYEFQVTPWKHEALKSEAVKQARALRDHIDQLIAQRKKGPTTSADVLGRCVAQQGKLALTDIDIRTNLIGLIIGALPQLPIAVPQALDRLLARPDELADAVAAARANDAVGVARYLFEALRFDPMAPFLLRRCDKPRQIAVGTFRRSTVKAGALVVAPLESAMKDPRRIAGPESFDASRSWWTYLHFGAGLHTCFAEQINRSVIPAMLMPLLACDGLTRARGPAGTLRKRGFYPYELWVTLAPPPQPSAHSPGLPEGPTLAPA
jgi:cytochrome P450